MNYYELLGLSSKATPEEIKKAYRALAKKLHPDTEHGDEKLFKEINEAYEVLSHPKKREMYDNGEDPSTFLSGEDKAKANINNLMFTMTEANSFMADVSDLVTLIKAEINEITLKMRQELEENERDIIKYKTILARIKNADFLKTSVEEHISSLENKSELIDEDIETQSVMLELLSESFYETEVDEDMEWTPKGIGFING